MNAFSQRAVMTMELNIYFYFSSPDFPVVPVLEYKSNLDSPRCWTSTEKQRHSTGYIHIAEYANQVCLYRDKWRLRYSMERRMWCLVSRINERVPHPPISVLIFFLKVKLHLRDCYCIWVYNETDTCQLESTKVEGTKKQTR